MNFEKVIMFSMNNKFAFVLMAVGVPTYGLSLHSSIRIAS